MDGAVTVRHQELRAIELELRAAASQHPATAELRSHLDTAIQRLAALAPTAAPPPSSAFVAGRRSLPPARVASSVTPALRQGQSVPAVLVLPGGSNGEQRGKVSVSSLGRRSSAVAGRRLSYVHGAHAHHRDLDSGGHGLAQVVEAAAAADDGAGDETPMLGDADAAAEAAEAKAASRRFLGGLLSTPQLVGLVVGVVLLGAFSLTTLDAAYPSAGPMLGCLSLVASLWMFEVMPLPTAAVLPMALLPLFGVLDGAATAKLYWNHISMMFIGAFIVDIGIEHVNLHQRVALRILLAVGVDKPSLVVANFLLISAALSTVCSNVATAVMLVPFATGILDTAAAAASTPAEHGHVKRFSSAALLAIAYGSSCGGIATLIGTSANGVLAGQANDAFPGRVDFVNWLLFATPLVLISLCCTMASLYAVKLRGVSINLDAAALRAQYDALGPMNRDEALVLLLLLSQIFMWVTRPYLIEPLVGPTVASGGDAATACAAAVLIFLIPSKKRPGEALLTWAVAQQHLPWGVLVLMGGGFALAGGCQASGLTTVVGSALAATVTSLAPLPLVVAITTVVGLLTQLTSNTATANTILPLLIAVSEITMTHPLLLLLPATAACSFAFMLPASTPPNSIIFGTGRLPIVDFLKVGTPLNLMVILLGALTMYFSADVVYGALGPFPEWACKPPNCVWLRADVELDRTAQACAVLDGDAARCRLRDGSVVRV